MDNKPPKGKAQKQAEMVPMCKICETRHWSRDDHNFPKPKTKSRRKK